MEKNNGNVVAAGFLIALGLFLLGYMLKSGIENFKDKERVVSVKGLAEKEVPADRVIWPLMYKEVGNNLVDLYSTMERKNAIIVDFLTKNGLSQDEITLSAPEIIDMQAERYGNDRIQYRYNVTAVLTVTSSKVELVRNLIGSQSDLLKQGIAISGGDYRYQTQFLFTALNDIKPEMIEEATKNARATASKFAEDSNSKLGKIRTAYQGQFSISDRDANTPYIKNVRVVTTVDYYLND
ncbi:SIMPL domain-containing protein [Parabacteroides sp. OttesenSCG-928-G21]|nr:SIMPL domain-containing protein [Parabacteroides sp. OttesenSCG-928-G21]